ncbi:MAG: hypothetical protein Q9221_007866 [Calogaya cf. arnoldii]
MPYIKEHTRESEDSMLEPIAIVGMACRLPGSIDSATKLWDLLVKKGSAQTPKVPPSRFNIDAHFHEDLERPGSFNVAGGYFLDEELENFDPTFFGITPVEAMWMDPQQRKILEVCYECLESAGLTLDSVSGTNTAVFVGSFTSDYQQMSIRDPDFRHNYAATGVDPGIISNRIGNTFNLKGPSFTINTACSSSIYAIHNACNALRANDCEAAITGGVNLILTVDQHMNTAKLGILSPTSTCHTFDKSADGYGRAEGAGALYLKRLKDAIRDGNPIRGVIRGSAVNTNGKVAGMGITHPSASGQEQVVRMAYDKAKLDQSETAYLECHGTGTAVGDPIEARAVANAMNDTRSPEDPLLIGALKANIGHSEAASGIFAVMKAAMVTENGVIPGVAGLKELNPEIDEEGWNIKVQRDTALWPESSHSRRAGVSSFGYGGTNGHVIVEEANAHLPWYQHGKPISDAKYDNGATRPFMVAFSAHDKPTLQKNIAAHAKVANRFYLADLAHTLNTKRTKLAQRAFTIARQGNEEADFDLSSFHFISTVKKPRPDLAFAFTGQGAQWVGMAVEATKKFPSFVETIRRLDSVLQRLKPPATWSLEEVLLAPEESNPMNDAEIAQPICTAVQIAITDLLARWKIHPVVTVGHSSGEIGAGYAAGRISAPEAIVAAFYRGFTVKHHAPSGAMLAVGLGIKDVFEYLGSREDAVVACENSPSSVTLSGTAEAIKVLKADFDKAGAFARELKTDKAYHSPQMAKVAPIYNGLLSTAISHMLTEDDSSWRQPRARLISSVTAEELQDDHIPVDYWSQNLRSRVLFDSAVSTLANHPDLQTVGGLVEIGPHSALAGPLKQIFTTNKFDHLIYIPTLVRGSDSAVQLLKTAGELFVRDYPLDVEEVNVIDELDSNTKPAITRKPHQLVDLPSYQWNYDKKYWAEARFSEEQRHLQFPRHDLLGSKIAGLSEHSLVWRNVLSHKNIPWLRDHRLGNETVFPAAGHLSLAIEAVRQVSEARGINLDGVTLRDIAIKQALTIPESDDGIEIQLRLHELSKSSALTSWYSFAVESISDGQWTVHCEGSITPLQGAPRDPKSPVDVTSLTKRTASKRWYSAFHRVGFQYERSFQPLGQLRTNRDLHHAATSVKTNVECGLMPAESRYLLHPSTVDACLQLIIISINAGDHKRMSYGVVPIKMEEVSLWFPDGEAGSSGRAIAWTDELNGRYFNTHTKLVTESGQLVLDVKSLRCVAYEAAVPQQDSGPEAQRPYSELVLKPDIKDLTTEKASQVFRDVHSEADCVGKIVELINHKSPLNKLLFMGPPNTGTLDRCVQDLALSSTITIGCDSAEASDAMKAINPRILTVETSTSTSAWLDVDTKDQDLVIVPEDVTNRCPAEILLKDIKHVCKEDGLVVICSKEDALTEDLNSVGLSPKMRVNFSNNAVMVFDLGSVKDRIIQMLTVLTSPQRPEGLDAVLKHLESEGCSTQVKTLPEANDFDTNILLYDIEGTLLSHLHGDNWDMLKRILTSGNEIFWLNAGVNEGESVFGGMVASFLRALRSEQAASKLLFLDVDTDASPVSVADFILSKLGHVVIKESGDDTEFYLSHGISHIGRIVPNPRLNDKVSTMQEPTEVATLPEGVAMQGNVTEGELIFALDDAYDGSLAPDQIELQVSHSNFDKKSPLAKKAELVVGKVLRTGSDVGHLRGQNAIAYTTDRHRTIVKIPARLCITCNGLDAALLLTALPDLCQIVNAIIMTGKVEKDERLLLLPAPTHVVIATIVLCRAFGIKMTVVADSSQDREEYQARLQLPSDLIILAKDVGPSFAEKPAVVVAHDFSRVSQEVWRCMPPTGRFILVDSPIDEAPDALPLARGASFLSTSTEVLHKKDQNTLGDVLRLSVHVLQANKDLLAQDIPMVGVGSINDAPDTGIMAMTLRDSTVKIQPSQKGFQFSPEATYVLVGCLGGLGRSLTTWMMERGCKNFVFISRSGADKPEAAQVTTLLQEAGASVRVFRADATVEEDVMAIVADVSATHQIRGVVHAAMVLKDGIYEQMTFDQWSACVAPKVQGAWSLHKALKDAPLDFFVMTSSISAVLGNPGQSNYCAANGFLDALAWHRNVKGLPATSLALPMVLDVGVVAENEDIEDSLSRKGMYGIDEQEMLQGFEMAMMQPVPKDARGRRLGDAQIILGLETGQLAAAMASNDTADAYWFNDARLKGVRSAVEDASKGAVKSGSGIMHTLSKAVADGPDAAIEAISRHIMERCSKILMRDVEEFEMDGPSVADYGLDSMIGAELRNWLFKEFGLDMPFQRLLAPKLTFKALSVEVGEKVGVVKQSGGVQAGE